ncbi:MAG: hypothetical protein QXP80_03335 [Zestosphaera sp.]
MLKMPWYRALELNGEEPRLNETCSYLDLMMVLGMPVKHATRLDSARDRFIEVLRRP